MRANILIIGGDERELEVGKVLQEQGLQVKVVGFDNYPHSIPLEKVSLLEAVDIADAIITPLPGTNDKGSVYALYSKEEIHLTREVLKNIKTGIPLFIGKAKPFFKNNLQIFGIKIIEVAEMDEVAIINSIPTAEGAIQLAMEETKTTIHSSHSMVIGFGRCGFTLARMLYGLGAKVTVTARDDASLARAYEMGFQPLQLEQIENRIENYEIIFNTVPAMVVKKELIEKLNPETLIIDIASRPGGTDFQAAKKRGIKAFLALGLPGRVAPKTAGQLLARIYIRLLQRYYEKY